MSRKKYIGCCGAYCKTCKAYIQKHCQGCKLGYKQGGRDINKARCKIKLCCFRDKKLETCADCPELESCRIITDFWGKNAAKYKKYKEAIDFIRSKSYLKFIEYADKWKGPFGKLK